MGRRIEEVAAGQHGVFHRTQAREQGFSEWEIVRLLRSGRWETVLPGVYRVAGAPETWEQRLTAALLWAGELGVLSHDSAAALWSLDGFKPGPVHVTVPYALRHPEVTSVVVHRTRRIDPRDRVVLRDFPVTTPERTLVDLAAHLDEEALEIAMESAFRRNLSSVEGLWVQVHALTGRRGLRTLRRLLRVRQSRPAHSLWEVKLLRLIREAGLPEPVRQYEVWDGETVRKLDLAYPDLKVAIEYDSYTWHSGRQAWERYQTRNANLIALLWRILPVTSDDVDLHPRRTIRRIAQLLGVCTSVGA